MKLGVVINTYQKSDNLTPPLLTRAINSVKEQTHQDYTLIIIGDKYEDNDEFESICYSSDLGDKLIFKNLPYAKEREKYPLGSDELWCSGGVNARNVGINIGLELGLGYICHLDHDDYWHPQHLEIINHAIKTIKDVGLVYTCGTYFGSYLPNVPLDNQIIETYPTPCNVIHSSVCINHSQIPLLYRDVYEEEGRCECGDIDMWLRISDYIEKNNLKSYLIKSLTCFHPTERQ
jgi:glycosyltransferase involved in cell wall biosynthesis